MRTTTSTVAMAMDMVATTHMPMVPTLTPMATHSMDSRTALRRITTLSTTPSTEAGLASLTDILVATLTDTVLTTSTPMVVLLPLPALLQVRMITTSTAATVMAMATLTDMVTLTPMVPTHTPGDRTRPRMTTTMFPAWSLITPASVLRVAPLTPMAAPTHSSMTT